MSGLRCTTDNWVYAQSTHILFWIIQRYMFVELRKNVFMVVGLCSVFRKCRFRLRKADEKSFCNRNFALWIFFYSQVVQQKTFLVLLMHYRAKCSISSTNTMPLSCKYRIFVHENVSNVCRNSFFWGLNSLFLCKMKSRHGKMLKIKVLSCDT